MSGSVAAHAAHNGSGTQGLAVTNKIHDDEGDVMSPFWNKHNTTRHLLYGASVLEIPTSGGGGAKFGGSQIFTVNNDIDCIGDMYAEVTIESATAAATVNPLGLAQCIDRVEFQVGTQIWQTLEKSDLLAIINTEMSEGTYERFVNQANGFMLDDGSRAAEVAQVDGSGAQNDAPRQSVIATGEKRTCYVPLPILTKTLKPQMSKFADHTEDGYPMAAAPHQSVKIKLSYAHQDRVMTMATGAVPSLEVKLFAQHMIMSNEERSQMKAMPQGLPKRLKMTQNASKTLASNSSTKIDMDLDHFSLYASHLIISLESSSTEVPTAATSALGIDTAELKLNSSSYSGVLKGHFMNGPAAESLGIFNNYLSKRSSYLGTPLQGMGYYVFPLAARAYGGSSVPLNRFDNIRLSMTFSSAIDEGTINVTCCGETTALFKGGAASLAMY